MPSAPAAASTARRWLSNRPSNVRTSGNRPAGDSATRIVTSEMP